MTFDEAIVAYSVLQDNVHARMDKARDENNSKLVHRLYLLAGYMDIDLNLSIDDYEKFVAGIRDTLDHAYDDQAGEGIDEVCTGFNTEIFNLIKEITE